MPLSPRVVAILGQLEKVKAGEFVFPGQARNKPLSNMAMEMILRRMKIENATVHGFRSSFRDWAGNVSSFPREVVETALAHVIGDKAEQAYRRRDALEKRRKLTHSRGRSPRDTEDMTKLRTIIRRESHWQSRVLRKRPPLNVETARNSLSQWPTPATAVANRRK